MANIEAVSSSVVREYLSRKGLKETLAMLDKEMPRTDNCISNRAQLGKELHINTLMKKNKESQKSFRTMLEVIVQFMMTKTWQQKHSEQNLTERGKTLNISSARDHGQDTAERSCEEKNINLSVNVKQTEIDSIKMKNDRSETKQNFKKRVASPDKGRKDIIESSESRTSFGDDLKSSLTDEHERLLGLDNKSNDNVPLESSKMSSRFRLKVESHLSVDETEVAMTSVEKQFHPAIRNTEGLSGKTNQDRNVFGNPPGIRTGILLDPSSVKSSNAKKGTRRHNISGGIISTGLHSSGKDGRTREKAKYFAEDLRDYKDTGGEKTSVGSREKLKYLVEDLKESSDFQGRRSPEMRMQEPVEKKDQEVPDWKREIMKKREVRKNLSSSQLRSTENVSREDLIFEDIDENIDDELDKLHLHVSPRKSTMPLFPCQAITLKQAKDLKTIVFGSPVSSFNTEWRNQGFTFCHLEHLKYGIVQHKGGPCGLLASVQAVVLKQLLFNDRLAASKQRLHFSSQETNDALCSALVEILWRAGSCKTPRVALRSEKDQFMPSGGYKADRLTEKLVIYETNDCNELEIFMKENVKQFSCDDGGCILLLYSVILSRTVEKIKEDMDDESGTLMGAHGYCTQDMVNLLLTGKAISNTFDDVIELDSGGDTKNILKGVDKQSDIGLLSLFEHYKSCLVGSNLKSPKYPIWVVCSESHFSVMFSVKRSLVNERRSQKKFDLYYYDGLAGQTEEIRLTVDRSRESMITDTVDDLTPPLEHCIRTKWKDAVIDWNGTEPLL